MTSQNYKNNPKMATTTPINVGSVVIPGETVEFLSNIDDKSKIILGPGLRRIADTVTTTKCGILNTKPPNLYWIDSRQKRYITERGDDVIGVVTNKIGDSFRVDIGTSEPASISYLAFEGATKNNRPNVKIGDILYAKLLLASKDMEPELVCVDSYGKCKGLGILNGGFVFQTPLHVIRKLRSSEIEKMMNRSLVKFGAFEMALGMNGRVWVKAKSVRDTIIISNVVSLMEYLRAEEIEPAVNQIVSASIGF